MALSKLKRIATIGSLLAGAMFLAFPECAWAKESCTIRIIDNTAIRPAPIRMPELPFWVQMTSRRSILGPKSRR